MIGLTVVGSTQSFCVKTLEKQISIHTAHITESKLRQAFHEVIKLVRELDVETKRQLTSGER